MTNIQILSLIKTTFTENSLKCHGTLTSSQYLRTVFKSPKKVLEIEPNYCLLLFIFIARQAVSL